MQQVNNNNNTDNNSQKINILYVIKKEQWKNRWLKTERRLVPVVKDSLIESKVEGSGKEAEHNLFIRISRSFPSLPFFLISLYFIYIYIYIFFYLFSRIPSFSFFLSFFLFFRSIKSTNTRQTVHFVNSLIFFSFSSFCS